jgi:hypothetical protein
MRDSFDSPDAARRSLDLGILGREPVAGLLVSGEALLSPFAVCAGRRHGC